MFKLTVILQLSGWFNIDKVSSSLSFHLSLSSFFFTIHTRFGQLPAYFLPSAICFPTIEMDRIRQLSSAMASTNIGGAAGPTTAPAPAAPAPASNTTLHITGTHAPQHSELRTKHLLRCPFFDVPGHVCKTKGPDDISPEDFILEEWESERQFHQLFRNVNNNTNNNANNNANNNGNAASSGNANNTNANTAGS